MTRIVSFLRPLARFAAPLAAAGFILTGSLGGERTALAEVVETVVAVAPPAPRVEVVSVAPSARHFWTPGYWGYRRGYGHQWNPGVWQVYRPGYTWSQPAWVRVGGGWSLRHGGWSRGGCHHR